MYLLRKLKTIFEALKHFFFTGLFTIIPIAATLFFLSFAYNFTARCLDPLRKLEPSFLQKIPGSEFVLVTLLIIILGIILKGFILHSILHQAEKLIAKIPFVRIVYSASKILVEYFKTPKTAVLKKKVVLIPYPKKGQYHLAFLLESAHDNFEKVIPDELKHYKGEKYYKVFMPNSPNPTSGYFFIMHEDDIIPTDITFEEALKTLISCGLITPETLYRDDLPAPHTLKNSAENTRSTES